MDHIKELRKRVGHRPLILAGAVVIILNQHKEILLQQRTDDDWGLPGGLLELGES
ncbi:NUDIX domain-containing protein, partial [Rossellomorea marisflavi]